MLLGLLSLLSGPVFAVCDLETLYFMTQPGTGQVVPIPRTPGCTNQIEIASAGTASSQSIPTGAKYLKIGYNGDAVLVPDNTTLNKYGSNAGAGSVTSGTAWPFKPTFYSLDAISATAVNVIKAQAANGAVSITLEYYK